MKRDFFIQKSRGLKGGPNHVQLSVYGYRADSPDKNNPVNQIPTGRISMDNVPHPVMGIDNMGNQMMMQPGGEYQFPGNMVTEFPVRAYGGEPCFECGGGVRHFQMGGPNPGEPPVQSFPVTNAEEVPQEDFDALYDQYIAQKAAYDAEMQRVQGLAPTLLNNAQKKDEGNIPTRTNLGWIDQGKYFCNSHTCELLGDSGYTVPGNEPVQIDSRRTLNPGDKFPLIPGNMQMKGNLGKMGFVPVSQEEWQPGDVVQEELFKNSDYQGNTFSDRWVPSHSTIYAGNENGEKVYYNAPGGARDDFAKTPVSGYGEEGKDWRMQGYRYVGNTPALEEQMNATKAKLAKAPVKKMPMRPIAPIPMSQNLKDLQPTMSQEQMYAGEVAKIQGSDLSKRKQKKAIQQLDANFEAAQQYGDVIANRNVTVEQMRYGGYPAPDKKELLKNFKQMAKNYSKKQFGGTSKAPQNVTTDSMVQYNKDIMKNAMARNNFNAMAQQEAEALAQQMAGQMMPPMAPPMMAYGGIPPGYHMMPNGQLMQGAQHRQMGGQNFGYKPNQNVQQWANAYGDMKQNNQQAFKNMIGASGELAGSIYANTDRNDLELKRLKTKFTDKDAKKEYKQYAKNMKQQNQPVNEWDMFNQNINEMQKKNQPINMNQMGPVPGMGGMNSGFFPYGGQPMMYPYGGQPMYQFGGGFFPLNATANQYDYNQYDYGNDPYLMDRINQPMISDPTGGIGVNMYKAGFVDVSTPYTQQKWVPAGIAQQYVQDETTKFLDANRPTGGAGSTWETDEVDETIETNINTDTDNGTTGGGGTDDIKTFDNAANVVEDATKGTGDGNGSGERRGNVTEELDTPTTTRTTQQGQPGRGFFVTQPGSYNLNPTGRWQRGPGMNVGPAVAYNPADTYLDEYTYKGRMFGKGPRKVKMKFSHYGQPGMPGAPEEAVDTPVTDVTDSSLTPGDAERTTPGGFTPSAENTSPAYNPENRGTYQGTNAGSSPANSTHGMMDKVEDINSQVNQYMQDNPQEMTPEQWAAANPDMLNAISSMAYGGYVPAMMYGGPIEAFPQAQMYPTFYRQQGGGIPFPEAFPQAQMYPRTGIYMQGGGENPVGTPMTEGPWGQTQGVWGRKGPDGATMIAAADAGLAGMAGLAAIGNQGQMRAFEDQMKQKTLGDANFMANTQGDRGKWTQNQGYIDPRNMVPTQFQGMNTGAIGSGEYVKYGGQPQYQDGGEYNMSQAEIDQILAMGGTVEYLD